jgi:hypothetical protein
VKSTTADSVRSSRPSRRTLIFLSSNMIAARGMSAMGCPGEQTVDAASHFRHAGLFWIGILIAALAVFRG